jgi:hypothetical protein
VEKEVIVVVIGKSRQIDASDDGSWKKKSHD